MIALPERSSISGAPSASDPAFPPARDQPDDTAASLDLVTLIHHREAIKASLPLAEVQRLFQENPHDFLAMVDDDDRVVGLCARGTVGIMLGSRYGFALYGNSPVWSARAPRPLIYPSGAAPRLVLDEAFSRTGSEFFEDIVLVDSDGQLVGLVPVPSLANLQVRLFGEQLERVVAQDEELRQQNLELFQVNHQLRQSQGRYKALFENNALGVALLQTDGMIVAHNRRFEQLLQLSERPVPASFHLAHWVTEADRPALQRLLATHEAGAPDAEPRLSEIHFDFSRAPRLFELHSSWVVETGQICVFLEDITDQRALEQRLARQEKQNMLDTLVAGVAHELNNKLTPVLGFADLLRTLAPESLHGHTRCISQSAQEAAQIIRQLLSLSRPAGNAHDLLDLGEVCREALQMLRFQLREAQCAVELQLPAEPVGIQGDAAQLKQVLINLALNALHAMEGRPAPCLTVQLRTDGSSARLCVRDSGVGIPPENLARIFDPFFTTKGPRGTGLGLSISANLIRQHGGDITAESTPGQGSTFSIRLPLSATPATARPAAESAVTAAAGHATARHWRALVVDDEEFVRQFMQEALRLCFNCRVDIAGDGDAAIELLKTGAYDLVLSDIRMPRRDGLQLRSWLLEHQPRLAGRMIFVTGHAGDVELDQSLARLPCPVIRKPFTMDAVRSACATVLRATEDGATA
ncbi:MAG: response regulator [Opitutae bacterium]|nr:response regulator [Opitutae bacterium]